MHSVEMQTHWARAEAHRQTTRLLCETPGTIKTEQERRKGGMEDIEGRYSSLISSVVIEISWQKAAQRRKGLFCLQFQIIVHSYREVKAGT